MDEKDTAGEEREARNPGERLSLSRIVLNALLVVIVINLVGLDIVLLHGGIVKTVQEVVQSPVVQATLPSGCSSVCTDKINQAISELKLASPSSSISPSPVPLISQKEYYIPFGSGSFSSTTWQDIPGLEAYIASGAYGTIKNVTFEVSLHVPTGNENVSVRLYDATDNHPVWNSQINFSGNTESQYQTSQSISLDPGNKLYKVQIETQLNFQAVIDQSRVHITAE